MIRVLLLNKILLFALFSLFLNADDFNSSIKVDSFKFSLIEKQEDVTLFRGISFDTNMSIAYLEAKKMVFENSC